MVAEDGSCPSGGQGCTLQNFNWLVCWWVGLCSLLVSLCGLRQPSPVVYRFYDRANIIGIPPRGIKPTDTSQDPCCQCPQQATANTYLLRRPSNSQRQVWSVSCGVTAPFRWVLVHTRYSLCPPQESLFPSVLWKFCDQILLSFKVRFPLHSTHSPRMY